MRTRSAYRWCVLLVQFFSNRNNRGGGAAPFLVCDRRKRLTVEPTPAPNAGGLGALRRISIQIY